MTTELKHFVKTSRRSSPRGTATKLQAVLQHRTPSLPQLVTISDSSVQETPPKASLLPLQSILSCCLCASDAQHYSTAKVEQKEKRNQTSQLVSLLRNAPRLEEEERRGPFPALVRLCFHFLWAELPPSAVCVLPLHDTSKKGGVVCRLWTKYMPCVIYVLVVLESTLKRIVVH